jgi:hypothetical protein
MILQSILLYEIPQGIPQKPCTKMVTRACLSPRSDNPRHVFHA